jgi:uncharacterized membrane protein YdjX (TVP38/TMEM64 family)
MHTAAKLAAAGAVIGLAYWGVGADRLATLLDPEQLTALLNSAGPIVGPLILMGVMALAVVVSPLPSLPIDAAAGAAFGPWLGTLYAALGALVGSLAAFGIARLLGRDLVERLAGGHIQFCRECSDKLLLHVVFLARLLPFLSFDVVSYGAGLTKLSATRFAAATFLGMLPLTFVFVSFGSLVRFSGATLVAGGLVAVAIFLLLPRWIERNDLFGLRRFFAAHLDARELD